jgi:hypothetical protein
MASGITFAGRGSLRIANIIYNCTAISGNLGGENREKVVGFGGPAGDKVEKVAPSFTATILVTPAVSLKTLGDYQDEDAEILLADGRSFTYGGASVKAPPMLDTGEGTCDVECDAMFATEVNV